MKASCNPRAASRHVSTRRLACLSVNRLVRPATAQARATQAISLHRHLARQVQLLQSNWQFFRQALGGQMVTDEKVTNHTRLGFIGLGYMGSRIAGRLVAAGFPMIVYNRDRTK